MLGSWNEQTELRTGKGVLPSRKRRKPTEKAFFLVSQEVLWLIQQLEKHFSKF